MSSLAKESKAELLRLIAAQVTELNALRSELSKLRVQRVADNNKQAIGAYAERLAAARAEALRTGKCVTVTH